MTAGPLRSAALTALSVGLILAAACGAKTVAPPPPSGTHFPDFVYPAPRTGMSPAASEAQQLGWQWLQAGDLRTAERTFSGVVKEFPEFYPSEAALGYVALARKDYKAAVTHFDRAVAAEAAYAPALAGRGEALLALGDLEQALASFEAAVAADASLSPLQNRIEVLRFRGLQDDVAVARKAADAGHLAEARAAYERAIVASPQSPFLYRELATVERREGSLPAALEHAQKALAMEPSEPRSLVLIAEILEAQSEYTKAADTYAAAVALEPNPALDARIEALREKAAFDAMPAEYKNVEGSPAVNRAQVASLLGVRLGDLLKRARGVNPGVLTDTRNNWAAPWIMSVVRAGIMEPYPNHTFQPDAAVNRGDLAMVASRVLSQIAMQNPRLVAPWRDARHRFPDLSPGHLSYPAASIAVEAGVLPTLEDGSFQLSRPVTGAEAVAAVKKLEDLARRAGR